MKCSLCDDDTGWIPLEDERFCSLRLITGIMWRRNSGYTVSTPTFSATRDKLCYYHRKKKQGLFDLPMEVFRSAHEGSPDEFGQHLGGEVIDYECWRNRKRGPTPSWGKERVVDGRS